MFLFCLFHLLYTYGLLNMHCMQWNSPVAIYKALHADVTLIEVKLF